MHDLLDVDPRAVIDQITVLRIGHSANIELFQYEAPDQRQTHPRNSDWSGHHVAFYVKNIDEAVAFMESRGVEKFLGPFAITGGPAAGQSINYFKTPFGTYIELISYPNGMAYEVDEREAALVAEGERHGLGRHERARPARHRPRRDHRPGHPAALRWFEGVMGFVNPLTFGPISDPNGTLMHDLVDVDARSAIDQISLVRGGNGRASSCSSTRRPTRTARSAATRTAARTTSPSTCETSRSRC